MNAFAFHAHPEVWLLVGAVIACYTYAIRRIGPMMAAPGEAVVTRAQIRWFVAATAILWAASDWPIHDVGEQYLYSVHMLQHMMLSYFMPPMMLLAIPTWLMRLIIGEGRAKRALGFYCKPVVAGVIFNVVVMVTHIPGVVNESTTGPAIIHYGLHTLLVLTSLGMWMALCGPIPEWRIGPGPAMIYLFLNSLVPTVPAGWLVFAEGAVYKHYDITHRVWGLSVTYDQQIAGVIMKVGGSVFLWTIIIVLWFRRFAVGFDEEQTYRRPTPPVPLPAASIEDPVDALTYEQVTEAFGHSTPVHEPGLT